MIQVQKINGQIITLNAELIESVEAAPDTVISLVTGNRFVVKDTVEGVVQKVVDYRKRVNAERRVINPIEGLEKS
ncbi:MAG: flagellar protein FlbD [Elusimicrobia bacterium RIFCSPLOWO2_12_FULL_59_9]|nr:MAG: flagellar protein FlbD [Elusimicrobia bacterium RIFCSPLOWO2_12_FULL_59_9]